ncbi:MAG: hypothetical protein H6993_06585 [Pseudomonadales bacterium]|nr:hypothetical protein [Pseudomonadales bacterium]
MTIRSSSTAVRLWAGIDLAVTLPMAIPPWALWFVDTLWRLNALLGGQDTAGPVDTLYLFFLFLAGTLGVTWALARLVRPSRTLSVIDALARLWVAGLIVYCVTVYDAPPVLLAFVLTEVAGAAHQAWSLFVTTRQTPSTAGAG